MTQKALESLEKREQFLSDLYEWLSVESDTVMKCSEIQEETDNPFVQLVAEIIRGNAKTHIRILNLIHECLTRKAVSLTPDELGQIWELAQGYMETESKSIAMAEQAISSSRIFIIKQLLAYMLEDKTRNLKLVGHLEDFKKRLYPYL
jgi:hypothetical protein